MDAIAETEGAKAADAPRVFVSYARSDQARVQPLVAALSGRGYRVWWDRQISAGAAFTREIEASLRAADAVVVVWSAAAVASDWVLDEASLGRSLGRLVPVTLDSTSPPLGFGQYQTIDFSGWNGRADSQEMPALAAAVARVTGTSAPDPPPPSALSRPSRRLLALGAGAVAVAAAGFGAWRFFPRAQGSPAAAARTIAVLPFANLSGDASQDYFSEGLSEELINALARLGPLQVVGRTSSFQFKGQRGDSAAIGAKLGVANLLDGSVRRDGDTVRVSVELVTASSGFARWSQTYERRLTDVFTVETSIAEAVAQALEVRLLGDEVAALSRGGTTNAGAFDAYLKGRRQLDLGGAQADYRAALAEFDSAIAADPDYAAAHAARSQTLVTLGDEYAPAKDLKADYGDALASARRAVTLAPGLADAQAALAEALIAATRDYAGARQAWTLALAAGGGDARILARYGVFTCQIGDFGPGLAAAARAPALDPLNPRVFKSLGYCLLDARRYADAIAAMRRALALSPAANGAHAAIGEALLLLGRPAEALGEYAEEPVAWIRLSGEAMARHKLGDAAGAQQALQALAAVRDAETLYQQAQVLAQWGDAARAIQLLEAAERAGDTGLGLIKTDPLMDPVRRAPDVQALIARLGLAAV